MPVARGADGRFVKAAPNVAQFFWGNPIPKPSVNKPKTLDDLGAKIAEMRNLFTTKYQALYYQYGAVGKDGTVKGSAGPCFAGAGSYGKNSQFFGTHVFGPRAWCVSPMHNNNEWKKGVMLDYIQYIANDSCFAPAFVTKDPYDIVAKGSVFDSTKFSAQFIWCAAIAIRDCTEHSYLITTWNVLQKVMDRGQALFFAHLLQYNPIKRAYIPFKSMDGHQWFPATGSKNMLRQMIECNVDPLGGNGEPLCDNGNYYNLGTVFGKGAWAIAGMPPGPGKKIITTLGIPSSTGVGYYTEDQILDSCNEYIKTHNLKERA